jgi:predicted nucleic acid-binding protein
MIVVDASVIVTALGDDGDDGDRVRARLRGERLVAPHLVDLEIVSAWRRLAAPGQLDDRRVALAMTDLGALRIERAPHQLLVRRCWKLRANLTVYEASYVALAEAIDAVLLTGDRRLAEARGVGCSVEVMS